MPHMRRLVDATTTGTLILAVVLFLAGGAIGIWALSEFQHRELADYATFCAGTVGPLWSAASLLLLVAGYSAQRAQLELQTHEIHNAAIEQQRNRLEGRFYQLLQLHNIQVEHIDASAESKTGEWLSIRGKRCLYSYYSSFRSHYRREFERFRGAIGQDPTRIRAILEAAEANRPASIYGYYISVDSLLKALDRAHAFDSSLSADLGELLAAQFGDFELLLVFARFYSDARFSNALALARKFDLFRYYSEESIWRELDVYGERGVQLL